ncbi:RNA polymerase sigma factor [Streptomyces sp. L7]
MPAVGLQHRRSGTGRRLRRRRRGQETMLRVLAGLPGLEQPDRFRSWLVAIAVRQVRDRWRGRQVRPDTALLEEGGPGGGPSGRLRRSGDSPAGAVGPAP